MRQSRTFFGMRPLLVLVASAALLGCPPPRNGNADGGARPTGRCEVDLLGTGLFSRVGTSSAARVLAASDPLIGGPHAEARAGDVLLENDRLRVILSAPGRHFGGAVPFGGWIVDADLKRPSTEAGRDQFGRMGLLYALGRTVNASQVDIVEDGRAGGPAIVAMTGTDTLNDAVAIDKLLSGLFAGSPELAVDPDVPRIIKASTYYVLSPGENRVRVLTQICNDGPEDLVISVGDMIDPGGAISLFNPKACSGSLGKPDCDIDPTTGFGFLGDDVSYGYRGYRSDNLSLVSEDALIGVEGALAVVNGAKDSNGVLTWFDPQATQRPGNFSLRPGQNRSLLRDFFVVRDLADLTTTWLALDSGARGRFSVTVQNPDGSPAEGARVAVRSGGSRLTTLLVTGSDGKARADVPPGTYSAVWGQLGHAIDPPATVQIGTNGTTERTFVLGASRKMTVAVKDPFDGPLPAKVTLLCPSGTCPTPMATYGDLFEVETVPTEVAAIGFVPPSGTLDVRVAPGAYQVVVSRGPEYSVFPQTWPASGHSVDLTSGDATISATLARVVDTQGWTGIETHVHASPSVDSSVPLDLRVSTLLAEGVEVVVPTDHDAITDYGGAISGVGGQPWIAQVPGTEISTTHGGHFTAYPLAPGEPFDWAGGADSPALTPAQLFSDLHELNPAAVVQVAHARGTDGAFTDLRVDSDTLGAHVNPAELRMVDETPLLSAGFDAFEITEGATISNALLNDWMTQLSSGRRKTGVGASDSHYALESVAGYSRTWVAGNDHPAQVDPATLASNLRAMQAIVSNAPFVRFSARRLEGGTTPAGDPIGIGATLSLGEGDAIQFTVDVQSPEWIRFDTIELHTHAAGREARNGIANTQRPVASQTISLDGFSLPLEPVPDTNGRPFDRVRVSRSFTVQPTADTWYLIIVRTVGATPDLFPLAWDGVSCSGSLCTADSPKPFAVTNPIFVDADGSGAYDDFPQNRP